METSKPKPTANFSFSERNLIIKLGVKYKNIIENKKTDAVTWRQKENIWKSIEEEYNSCSNGPVSIYIECYIYYFFFHLYIYRMYLWYIFLINRIIYSFVLISRSNVNMKQLKKI